MTDLQTIQLQTIVSCSVLQPLSVRIIASDAQNVNMIYSILFKNRTKDFITDIHKLTFGQTSNNL